MGLCFAACRAVVASLSSVRDSNRGRVVSQVSLFQAVPTEQKTQDNKSTMSLEVPVKSGLYLDEFRRSS